jgi:muramidase (phage lysozyme)
LNSLFFDQRFSPQTVAVYGNSVSSVVALPSFLKLSSLAKPFSSRRLAGWLTTALFALVSPLAASAAPRDSFGAGLGSPVPVPSASTSQEGSSQLATSPSLGRQLEQPAPRLALLDVETPASAPFPVASPPPVRASFPITPARRALLNTIRYSEGTWADGQEVGYRILFGGGLMRSLERHPNLVIRTARYASAAAGAYQFMPFTWSMASRLLGLQRFSPDEQDQAALLLIQRRGALALADEGRFTPGLAARLAPEWASFPTLRGGSYYGQPVRRYAELKRFYEENLAQLLGQTPQDGVPGSLAGSSATLCEQGQLVCRSQDATGPSL